MNERQIAYRCGTTLAQEALEVASGEQLQHYEARMALETDANEVDDVGMNELGHDHRLHQKVHLSLLRGQFGQGLRRRIR